MASKELKEISLKMKKLDLCMMTTIGKGGMTASRPMSNNSDVDYDGTSYFFTTDETKLVKDLKRNSHVNLSFNGPQKLFVSVSGQAKISHNHKKMKKHWVKNLEQWFENGIHTPGIAMIEVKAKRIKYWEKNEEKEVKL